MKIKANYVIECGIVAILKPILNLMMILAESLKAQIITANVPCV